MDTAVPRYEIRRSRNMLRRLRWHVVFIARNGEPLSSSESLNSEAAALENVEAQKALSAIAPVIRNY